MGRLAAVFTCCAILAIALPRALPGEAGPAPRPRPRIALALEGGGALGIAHIGVLKVLEDIGVPVDIVAGTSMGAVVGGLYAAGYDARGIESLMEGVEWSELFAEDSGLGRRTIRSDILDSQSFAELEFDRAGFKSRGGLVVGRNIIDLFDRATIGIPSYVDFDDLPRKYRAVATDLETGKEEDFSWGNLADAMRASMSFPAIFAPYPMRGRYYIDGGVVNNLPVDVAKSMGADVVIAVHLAGGNPYDPQKTGLSTVDTAMRSLDQLTRNTTTTRLAMADLVITVDLEGYVITDFAKSREILAKGEAAARAREGDIRAFLAKLGDPRPAPVPKIDSRPFAAVSIEGAVSESDLAEAAKIYAGVVGLAEWDGFLASAYDRLERTRKYESIRVGSKNSIAGRTLVVSLVQRSAPSNSIKLGLVYSGYYTDTISNKLTVTPGVVFRGFPEDGSEIHIDLSLYDTPGVLVDFIQPIYGALDLRASFSGRSGYETYYDANAANYQYETQAASDGLFLETGGFRHELFSLGWRFDWISSDDISSIYPCPTVRRASLLLVSSEYRRIDHPVLPTSGFDIVTDYVISLPSLGSDRYFQTMFAKCGAYIPLGESWSIGFKGITGTDFSDDASGGLSAPLYYKPALSDRTLFPAPLTIDETMGATVVGGGMELKLSLRHPTGLVNIPIYAVLDGATGTAIQSRSELETGGAEFHANATIGVGTRLDDAFGMLFRLGVNRNTEGQFKPFFAADIGAIPL